MRPASPIKTHGRIEAFVERHKNSSTRLIQKNDISGTKIVCHNSYHVSTNDPVKQVMQELNRILILYSKIIILLIFVVKMELSLSFLRIIIITSRTLFEIIRAECWHLHFIFVVDMDIIFFSFLRISVIMLVPFEVAPARGLAILSKFVKNSESWHLQQSKDKFGQHLGYYASLPRLR